MTTVDPAPIEGEQITIIPARMPGESRDTEPGLQSWKAAFVAQLTDGRVLIKEDGDLRIMERGDELHRAPTGQLILGRY